MNKFDQVRLGLGEWRGALQATVIAANDMVLEAAAGAVVVLPPSPPELVRTGDDYEFKLGGVSHFRLKLERAKQIARIMPKALPPIDLRMAPKFESIGKPSTAVGIPLVSCDAAAR
ncbi:hypothetical protein [Bradyrhizobium sp. USDA 4369]